MNKKLLKIIAIMGIVPAIALGKATAWILRSII